jgi:hypothetical protein
MYGTAIEPCKRNVLMESGRKATQSNMERVPPGTMKMVVFPRGLKPRSVWAGKMYGLKPVPFDEFSGQSNMPLNGTRASRGSAQDDRTFVMQESIKPCPFKTDFA